MGRRARSSLFVPLVISALFHLSMVTVFSICVWFKVEPVNYFSFHIVEPAPAESIQRRVAREPLNLPPLGQALTLPAGAATDTALPGPSLAESQTLTLSGAFSSPLPRIELPRLELAPLGEFRLRDRKLDPDAPYPELNPEPYLDSWARFGEGLDRLRDAFSRLPFLSRTQADLASRQSVNLPIEGFVAYIEWLSEPKDRELLFAAPMQGLLHFDRASLDEPLVLGFKVDANGNVSEVLTPVGDETGLVTSAGEALRQYRFEPAGSSMTQAQHGTLTIAAVSAEP